MVPRASSRPRNELWLTLVPVPAVEALHVAVLNGLPLHSEVALNLICSDVVVPPSLLLEVRNVGTKVIFPDGRLAVTSRVSRGEATLNIQRTSGDHVTFNCRVRMPCSHCPRPPYPGPSQAIASVGP